MERETEIIKAPFSETQVEALNFYQLSGVFHEFTCGSDINHQRIQQLLIATQAGWRCSDDSCDYTQNWAFASMADRQLIENQKRLLSSNHKTIDN